MTPRAERVSLDAYTMLERAYAFEYQRAEATELRALRWEALARQLGEALERVVAANAWSEIPWHEIRDSLSVYRDAIKEDGA